MIAIELDGPPVGKGRPRFVRTPMKRRNGKGLRFAYTPEKTATYEKALALKAKIAMRGRPVITAAVALTVVAMLPVPASWSKADRRQALAGAIRPTSKPDWDNYGKITDALNEIVWADDSQVVEALVIKRYAEQPGLRIEVEEIEHGEGLCLPRDDPPGIDRARADIGGIGRPSTGPWSR